MILTIDEGTTSTRALMIAENGKILGVKQKEIKQIYPQPGWVEHDPLEIWGLTFGACRELISELLSKKIIKKNDIQGIAITNQRETTIVWDPATAKPIYNAIVWQCRRTSETCKGLKDSHKYPGFSKLVNDQTGLLIDSYFSGTKIKWIKENIIDKNTDLQNKELYFGTIDTWLIWNLTLGREYATDSTNASRTMLYDIYKQEWSHEIIDTLKINDINLAKVLHSNANFGYSPLFTDLIGEELPILGVIGDQQAALYAYNNESKITYGTGTFALIPSQTYTISDGSQLHKDLQSSKTHSINERDNLFPREIDKNHGLVTSIAYTKTDEIAYALEGSIFVGGSIVQWLRDGLKIINNSSEIEELAKTVTDNGGVYLIPALAGLGAPYWLEEVRGAIFGITRATQQGHIARAALESIAYQVKDIIAVIDKNTLGKIKHINVDGGASKNNLLMQFQADLIQKPIQRYTESEMTALGAAKMTGKIDLKLKADKVFEPTTQLDTLYQNWKNYIGKLIA